MKTVLGILIGLFISLQLNAQDLEYGKVDVVDFTLEAQDVKQTPDAVIILKKEHVEFSISQNNGITQKRTVHERIKINTEAGLEYATKKILLYMEDGSIAEKFSNLEAATYNLVDGKVRRKKLKKSGVFEKDINDLYRVKSFTMPEAKIGSVIEFTYKIGSPYVAIDDFIVQYDIPILNIDVRMEWLESFKYQLHYNPRAKYVPEIKYDTGKIRFAMASSQRYGQVQTKTFFSNNVYERDITIVEFKEINIPAIISEPMVGNMENYRAEIKVELISTKQPISGFKLNSNTWETVSSSILESEDFGGQIRSQRFFKRDLIVAIKDLNTIKEKTEAILQLVKEKVKWDGYYGKYAKNGVKNSYEKGSGNVADINLLLIAMLKEAGLEACPVLVSTKNNGIPFYPTKDGFNYVIASVKDGDTTYLLDATEEHTDLNILPLRVMNWQGRLIEEKGQSKWVRLFPSKGSKEITLINGEFNKDYEVEITVQKRLTKYLALDMRDEYREKTVTDMQNNLKSGDSSMKVSNIETQNMDVDDSPLSISFDGLVTSSSEQIGDKLFITPLLHEANEENPFKLEKRLYPLDLRYPLFTKTIVTLKIPNGYIVESLPESVKFVFKDGLGSYTYKLSEANGIINVVADFDLNVYLLEPEDYEAFRKFFISIVSKDAQKVVLKKI
jgi:hypothetical protein